MPPLVWRYAALFAIVLASILVIGDALHRGPDPVFGFKAHVISAPGPVRYALETVDPSGPAGRAGLRAGDVVALAHDTYAQRVHYARLVPGDAVTFRVTHGLRERIVTVVAGTSPDAFGPLLFVYDALRVTLLCVALLVVLRRPERADARALANFLIGFAFFLNADPGWLPAWTTIPAQVLTIVAMFYATEQAARFATLFPIVTRGGMRAAIARANPYVCALFSLVSSFVVVDTIGFGKAPPLLVMRMIPVGWLYFTVATTLAFVIGNRRATGDDRQRGRWVSLSLALGFSGLVIVVVCEMAGRTDARLRFLPLTMIAIPVGTAYSILRHRVMDIGFAVNRAVVFTTLSAGVILAFSILEWLIGKYLTAVGHVTSAILELGVALIVGLSLQRIHKTIDRVVDDIFFRERHHAVRALQRFAYEATFITDAETLIGRSHDLVVTALRTRGCAIYIADRHGTYRERRNSLAGAPASLDENDALVVTLRAVRAEADMDRAAARDLGECAFPMIVRGELLGVLAVGRKIGDEALAPDERAAVAVLATATGNVVDALAVRDLKRAVADALTSDTANGELRARLRLLELSS